MPPRRLRRIESTGAGERSTPRTVAEKFRRLHPMSLGIQVVSGIDFNESEYKAISQMHAKSPRQPN